MKLIRALSFLVLAALFGGMSGCDMSRTSKVPDNPLAHLSDEEQLTIRTQERWAALMQLDMAKVYSFASPTYRATYDVKHLEGQYGAQVKREQVTVKKIAISDDSDTAKVEVLLEFVVEGFGGGANIPLSDTVDETWIKRDGQWWFLEPR